MEQGTLEDIAIQEKHVRAMTYGHEWENLLKTVARSIDRKTLAAVLGTSYTNLSDHLNGNRPVNGDAANAKPAPHWPSNWTGALFLLAPDVFMEEAGKFAVDICGYDHPEKKRTLTPEEELKALRAQIKAHGLEPLFKDIEG